MEVYGRLGDERRLLPVERDPLTGRRTVGRDEKHDEGRHRRPRRPSRLLVVAAAVVAVLVVAGAAVAALAGGGDDRGDEVAGESIDETEKSGGPGTGAAEDEGTTTTELVASAISLSYSGGTLETATCASAMGRPCDPNAWPWEPLSVRCTAKGCIADFFGQTAPIDGPTAVSLDIPYEGPQCGTAPVRGNLTPVGTDTTRGVRHPARITGTVTISIAPRLLADADCIGYEQVFVYDATPS